MSGAIFEDDSTRKVMRFLLLIQITATLMVFGLIIFEFYSLALAISFLTFIAFIAIVVWLYIRYRNIPIVRQKSTLKRILLRFQKSIETETNIIHAAQKEREELLQAEKAEIHIALGNLQKDHIENGLVSAAIKDAAIPGVGPKLKERLAEDGILNAAHITDKISGLPGFGEAKRLALLIWRSSVMAGLERTKPTGLTNEQLETIKQKYRELHFKNDAAGKHALASKLVLEYEVDSLEPRLQQLASITFVAYLSRSLASRGIIAALIALVLIITQVVSSVSATAWTASSIITSIPTATPTATLIPTAKASPAGTMSKTFTPTITDTPTLIAMAAPSQTAAVTPTALPTFTPEISLQPSRTPYIPVSGGGGNGNCDPSYPGVCIQPPPPDLDCGDISYKRFTVLPPDPHDFDRDGDGIGCES